jgi:hypothetical protein
VHSAAAGDGLYRFGEDRLGQLFQRFAMRLGEFGPHNPVSCVLVLVPLLQLRFDPEPVEGTAQEGRLDADSKQPDTSAGLQPDLVKRGSEDITGQVMRPVS